MKVSTRAAILALVVGLAVPGVNAAAPGGGAGRAGRGGAGAAPLMTSEQRPDLPPPVTMAAAADHQRLMDLLKVTRIRPGGQSQGVPPEANANPFGGIENLPDPLKMNDGTKVTSPDQWRKRRDEIVEMFDREIYGRIPKEFNPKITWEVTKSDGNMGGIAVVAKNVIGHIDMTAYPLIPSINLQFTVSTPANAGGPVPVILQFSSGGGGGGPGGAGRGRGAPGAAPGTAPAIDRGARGAMLTIDSDDLFFVAAPAGPSGAAAGPGAAPGGRAGRGGFGGGGAGGFGGAGGPGGAGGGGSWQSQCLAKGWGYGTINTGSIQADNGDGLTRGVIGLSLRGQTRKLDDWGVLRAWAWGASKFLDYLETDKEVDAKQVGLEGHSRWGKSTIVAMAYDERFATCYCSSSGEGGVKLHRRNYGELVENVAGTGEYHWMAGNFIKYGADPLKWSDMPVDSHELIAMCAPRPTFISGGAPNGDAWVDAKGMFLAAAGAQPVYALLGKKTMGTNEFPLMETPLIDGDIAFRQHSGGHTDGPNWPTFITFASRYLKAPPAKAAPAGQ